MEYRSLGRTDIKVSALCLGTMTWGEQNTEAEAHEQLDMALMGGINFIDTAEMYPVPPQADTQGLTEQYLGSWLRQRGSRERIILASKVAGPADWLPWLRGGPRFTETHIRQALEGSLRRLQTDYLDLYQLHWPERPTNYFGQLGYKVAADDDAIALEDTLGVLGKLQDEGKIRHIGLSNETAWGLMHSLHLAEDKGLPRAVSIQNPYSLLNRTFEVGLAECAWRENCGLLAYSPLAFGVLTGKYLHGARPLNARLSLYERFQRYTNQLANHAVSDYVELARTCGLEPAQMALAFVTQQRFVTSTIIGATSREQLQSNLNSQNVVLDEALLKAIDTIHKTNPNPCP